MDNPMYCAASGSIGTFAFENAYQGGYLPSENSLQYEGVFSRYLFETGEEKEKIFAPVFSSITSNDPISGKLESYICVGLNSCLDGDGLKHHGGRPPVNLALVLDISGSMGSPFSGNDGLSDPKIAVARDAIITGLLPQLKPKDCLSIIFFDDKADIVHEMRPLDQIDLAALKAKIQAVGPRGGTTLISGMKAAESQIRSAPDWQVSVLGFSVTLPDILSSYTNGDPARENRIFFLTDMCPTTSSSDGAEMMQVARRLAQQRIYTTFVGIGLDFNVDLTHEISNTLGCSYMAVKSRKEFTKLMNEQFDYLVSPICFNMKVALSSSSIGIERVFGSPGCENPPSGVLCEMTSAFASLKAATKTQGGVMLVKLTMPTEQSASLPFSFLVTYSDRTGKVYNDNYDYTFVPTPPVKAGSAARKGLLLTRFVSLMKHYLRDARIASLGAKWQFSVSEATGIPAPAPTVPQSSDDHIRRKDMPDEYRAIFKKFVAHFEAEAEALADSSLLNELSTLSDLLKIKDANQ